ncbi:MAG TPA: sporulation integral membrane protein YtvI [Moorella mulderi]|nr:sporulation integral membrane protein YtvI [Moorella mulderi]
MEAVDFFDERAKPPLQGILWALLLAIFLILLYYYVLPATWHMIALLFLAFLPFLLAVFLAALLDPWVNFLERKTKLGRGLAVLLALFLALALAGGILVLLFFNLVLELQSLALTLPSQIKSLNQLFQEYLARWQAALLFHRWSPEFYSMGQYLWEGLLRGLQTSSSLLLQESAAFLTALPQCFITLIITLVATFFCSRDKEKLVASFLAGLKPLWRQKALELGNTLGRALIGYLRAEILLISLQVLQVALALWLLRIEYPVTLALLIGLADLLPIVGPGTIFLPWIMVLFLLGKYGLGIALILLYALVILLRQLLQPRLVTARLTLHPLALLFALYGGLKAMGVAGLIIGPLLLIIFRVLWAHHREEVLL